MIKNVFLICVSFSLCLAITNPNATLGQKSEKQNIFGDFSNHTNLEEILSDNSNILSSNYTPEVINDIIYRLYQEIQDSNSTGVGRNHDIAVLIHLICSNEFIENAVEACDIVSDLQLSK
jgi:hypothetical protein